MGNENLFYDNSQFQVPGLNFSLGNIQQQVADNSLIPQVGFNGGSTWNSTYGDQGNYGFNSINQLTSQTAETPWYKLWFGGKNADGSVNPNYAGTALNLLQSGLGFYLGSQQLGQAEDALAENRRQFDLNYGAQKKLINDQLAWQYQARKDRNAANAGELTQI